MLETSAAAADSKIWCKSSSPSMIITLGDQNMPNESDIRDTLKVTGNTIYNVIVKVCTTHGTQ